MKKLLAIVISTLAIFLLSGCALFQTASNNKVAVPENIRITADSKPIEKIASIVGQTFTVKNDTEVRKADGSTERKIDLKSDGLQRIANWFVLGGGILIAAGILVAVFLKNFTVALSLAISGFLITSGTLFFKIYAKAIALVVGLLIIGVIVYEAWKHHKQIAAKAREIITTRAK